MSLGGGQGCWGEGEGEGERELYMVKSLGV